MGPVDRLVSVFLINFVCEHRNHFKCPKELVNHCYAGFKFRDAKENAPQHPHRLANSLIVTQPSPQPFGFPNALSLYFPEIRPPLSLRQ
jgi:hypothetical protein